MAAIQARVESGDAEVRAAAIGNLGEWADDAPLSMLLTLATQAPEPAQRILALRGAITVLSRAAKRNPTERVALYRQMLAMATRDDERDLALSGLATVIDAGALALVLESLEAPSLREEAASAAREIAVRLPPA